jgi:ribosome-associated protein
VSGDIQVNRRLSIPEDEIELRFSPSGGPGGQHANRSSTRVDLAWNVLRSRVLSERQRERIVGKLRNRIDASGNLRLSSDRHRSQYRNRADVASRLATLVADALRPARSRVATKPTRSAVETRLRAKRSRSDVKRMRRPPPTDD